MPFVRVKGTLKPVTIRIDRAMVLRGVKPLVWHIQEGDWDVVTTRCGRRMTRFMIARTVPTSAKLPPDAVVCLRCVRMHQIDVDSLKRLGRRKK